MAKTVLLILFLFIIAFFSGRTLMLASRLASGKRADFFSSFSVGSTVIICLAFAAHFLTVRGSLLLEDEKRLLGMIIVIFMTVSYFAFVILTVITGKTKKALSGLAGSCDEKGSGQAFEDNGDKEKGAEKNPGKKSGGNRVITSGKIFAVIAFAMAVWCFMTVVSGTRINSIGDETLETIRCFLDKGEMYSADPLTGMPYREGLPMRYKVLCLPGMYAVMCSAFGTSPEMLLHNIMPGFWFISGLFALIALSGALFGETDDELLKRSVFIASAVLFVFSADLSFYAQGFSVLSQMWTGDAIRIWVLIPVLLTLLSEKRYVIALLPVLCEALICRTAYGLGFLACIYAGWIVFGFIMRRCKCSKTS